MTGCSHSKVFGHEFSHCNARPRTVKEIKIKKKLRLEYMKLPKLSSKMSLYQYRIEEGMCSNKIGVGNIGKITTIIAKDKSIGRRLG